MSTRIHPLQSQDESCLAGCVESRRVRITKQAGRLNLEIEKKCGPDAGLMEGEPIVEKIWSNYAAGAMQRAKRILTPARLKQIDLPPDIIEAHFLTELYRPHTFAALLAEEIGGLVSEGEILFLNLPAAAGQPGALKQRFASIGRKSSQWRGWLGLAAAIPTVIMSLIRLMFMNRSTTIGPPVVDWVASVFGGKGNHTIHVWNWMEKHREVPILILGHKPLDKELRRKAMASGINIFYPIRFSDLPKALSRLVSRWSSILSLHSEIERDLGERSSTLFHARTACWFLRGFLHEAWVQASTTSISKGVVFGLIAHVDTRFIELAFRKKGIPTIHWLHGVVDDALHFRASCSVCLCLTPNDVRVRDAHGAYGRCVGPSPTKGSAPAVKTGGGGLLLVTNLLHPDNRFANHGAEDHLRALLETTALCREDDELVTWRPHPREAESVHFKAFARMATRLGMRVDNHSPFHEQLANCRRAISTPSTTIGDLAAAGIVPAIFDGLPFESSGHLKRLPSELTFKNSAELRTTFKILDDPENRRKYLNALLDEYPANRPNPDILGNQNETFSRSEDGLIWISIVTPSFKQVDFLKRCAASVQDQRGNFKVEHLVHDGGSGHEFEEWANTQHHASCVSEPDDGMYDAINRGFRKAGGEIIAWLNCDEQYLPGTLQRVSRYFEDHPETDILFGDIILVDEVMTPLAYRRAVMPTLGHIRYSHLSTFSAATFVRRRVLDDGHFLQTRWKTIADAVWIEELLKAGYRAATLQEPLAVFCMLGSNLGQSALLFEERREWEREIGATSKWWKQWYITEYRLERLRMGAYWLRKVVVSAYVPGNQDRVRQERWVSGRWTPARNEAANLRSHRNGALGGLTARLRSCRWTVIHAVCLTVIAIYVDGLTQGDAIKGPPILLFSLMYLSFRSRFRDLIPVAVLYFVVSTYLLSERPFDVLVVRLLTFTVGAALAIFWSASLRSLEEWIHSTVALIRRMAEPILLTDRHGCVILVNNSACGLLQGNEQQFLNRKLLPLELAADGSIGGRVMVYHLEERLPDEMLGLALDDEGSSPMAKARVFVVGRSRFRLYAFTLERP